MIEFYQDAANEWRWRIKAANGRVIAASSEGYVNESDARQNIKDVAFAIFAWSLDALDEKK